MANVKNIALNKLKTGMARSTPMTRNMTLKTPSASRPAMMNPVMRPTAGSNAQTEQMARTINRTNRVQQTYGLPGIR